MNIQQITKNIPRDFRRAQVSLYCGEEQEEPSRPPLCIPGRGDSGRPGSQGLGTFTVKNGGKCPGDVEGGCAGAIDTPGAPVFEGICGAETLPGSLGDDGSETSGDLLAVSLSEFSGSVDF